MTSSLADAFASLAALELITKPQRLAVEQHPARSAFLALHDPVRQLVWMHEQKIISEDELDDMMSFDQAPSEREAILQAAVQEIERVNDLRNGRLLDGLLRDGLITPTQHAAARRDPSGLYHESGADLLYSLILFDTVSSIEFDAVRQRLRANAGNNDGLRRLGIANDVHSRLTALKQARRSNTPLQHPDPSRARHLGWLYRTCMALLVAATAWRLLR